MTDEKTIELCRTYATARCNARRASDRYQFPDAKEFGRTASRAYATSHSEAWDSLTTVKQTMDSDLSLTDPESVLYRAGILS